MRAAVALPFTGWSAAYAEAQAGAGPYGPLRSADAHGIKLPAGFTSQIIARSGRRVADTGYRWHDAPDGGATFADGDGWSYVCNSEVPLGAGGVSMISFDAGGRVVGARRLLSGTTSNCAGGRTPWNTWLSCEEVERGKVFETYPMTGAAAVTHRAMGRFKHEAAAVDPERQVVYLTEDEPDGLLYRFVPTRWPDLSAGALQVLVAGADTSGTYTWAPVPDPSARPTPTRHQVPGAKIFNGGEGCYYANDTVWFTTKGDNRVWHVDPAAGRFRLAYDDNLVKPGPAPLTGVDAITGSRFGDLYVAEDNGSMEICVITPDGVVAPFLRVKGQPESELCGVAFNPRGDRLYFSSQRGPSGVLTDGITYCVTGPFRT